MTDKRILSVYLQDDVANVVLCFGNTMDEAVANILNAIDKFDAGFEDKPFYGMREGARRYNIVVTNQSYIELLNLRGANNPRVSLKRILEWFVYEELYETIDIQPVRNFKNDFINKQRNKLMHIRVSLSTLSNKLADFNNDATDNINNAIFHLDKALEALT